MRLRTITEDINRREFYDFYALLYAHQEGGYPDQHEIDQRLQSVTQHILTDHLNQLGKIVIGRLIDVAHEPTAAALTKFGITSDPTNYRLSGVDELPLAQKAKLVELVLSFNHGFGFTGQTWFGLGQTFVQLCHTPPGLNAQVMAVDKIYNLLHHGGQITDYMDERDWLEDALNTRDNANPAQILAMASSGVRALVGRAAYSGTERGPVSDLAKLHTAVRRVGGRHDGINTTIRGNELVITIDFTPLLWTDGKPTPWTVWNNKVTDRIKSLLSHSDGKFTLGKPVQAEITVTDDGQRLLLTSGGSTLEVPKPINRYFKLAYDLVHAAMSVVSYDRPLTRGICVSCIKNNYYHINGKPVKT